MPAFLQTKEIKTKDKGRQECLPHRCIVLVFLTIMLGSPGALAARPELRTVQSKYYLLHSDLDDALLYDLGTRMDAMYAEYSRRLSDFDLREDRKPLDAYLFAKKSDYTALTDSRY